MNITELYKSINSQMIEQFDHISAQIEHRGERGTEREAILATFLRTYLPSRFAVSRGEIVDTSLQTTRQCDLVIYDHLNCPMLYAGHDYRVFPAEPVHAVIEVKSTLSKSQLDDAAAKIRAVKKLERPNGLIAGIVFAYKSGWTADPLSHTARYLLDLASTIDPTHCIDLVCILDSGLVYGIANDGWAGIPKDFSIRQLWTVSPNVSPLLWFFISLLMLLDKQETLPSWPNLYLNNYVIGDVVMYQPYGPGAKRVTLDRPG
jgi:hypothetical protein